MILKKIKIGTRGSKLALCQAEIVKNAILKHFPEIKLEIIVISTKGDKSQTNPLSSFGTKGIFTKEIEDCLADKTIDLAVHSLKDMPVELPEELEIGAVLPREDPHDALISRSGLTLEELPHGTKIATGSLRRSKQLAIYRSDFEFVDIRGNIDTRLCKIDEGYADAVVLASAGLIRMGFEDKITQTIDYNIMLPSAGQGAIAVETRDSEFKDILKKIDCIKTFVEITAERSFLKAMGGGCNRPVGCLACFNEEHNIIEMEGGIFEDKSIRHKLNGLPLLAEELGIKLAEYIKTAHDILNR